MTAPRRRWSFGLRTMLVVVTAFACLLAYPLNWIRQRRDLLRDPRFVVCADRVPAPWPLTMFGETGPFWLGYTPLGTDELTVEDQGVVYSAEELYLRYVKEPLDRAARLFPESKIIRHSPAWYSPYATAPTTQADRP